MGFFSKNAELMPTLLQTAETSLQVAAWLPPQLGREVDACRRSLPQKNVDNTNPNLID